MSIGRGARFGPYEVAALIGVGGMGEVYRATDTNLKRDVALKVLPETFVLNADRLARFQREAEMLASLNHPNIAHIYGLERSDGVTALAMELVAGETLAERIARGPIAIDEALGIAHQIAEALEAAHIRGIVHRDLKPANIKLTPDGAVKVLDFGIAKAVNVGATSGPPASVRTTPTMTEAGVVLGTAAYMSPEQARGKSVDERADIWAFGCLLYEMLTGRPAFGDEDVTATLARVLERGADMSLLPPGLSLGVQQTIKLCLQKDLKRRVADIRDVRLGLEGAFDTTPSKIAVASSRAWIAAFAVAALTAAALAIPARQHLFETPPPETRLDIVTPATDAPNSFALSPDGRQLVFAATGEQSSELWLRSLATGAVQRLPGTARAVYPFWSPDSRSIGFFAEGALKRLDLGARAPQTLAAVRSGGGGTWNADGVIVFAPSASSGQLLRVSAAGGATTPVTRLGPQIGQVRPHFLPDGKRFLFFVGQGAPDGIGIYLGALDGSVSARLTPADGGAAYLRSGWLLWVRGGKLLAQRLDLARRALVSEPVTLADGVATDTRFSSGFSVSTSGLVAYRAGAGSQRQLGWFDRSGAPRGTLGAVDSNLISQPRLLPDGNRAVVPRLVQGNYDLWLLDGSRMSRVTFDAARDDYPQVAHDGNSVVFRSSRLGPGDLYKKILGRADPEELLFASNLLKVPNSLSADGRFLIYSTTGDPETNADLWVLPLEGEHTPSVFLKTPFIESGGAFSPDARWVAYHSNESGRNEVYVRPFIPPGSTGTEAARAGGQWQISTAGGIYPTWRADGRELYYLNPKGEMMATSINNAGDTLVVGAPEVLFPTRIVLGGEDAGQSRQYDVAADGRFLINMELDSVGAPITIVQSWNPETTQ